MSDASSKVQDLAEKKRNGELSGEDLGKMQSAGEITKSERRQISKLAQKPVVEKTARQLLREETKAKKKQPREKMNKDQRREKYTELDKLEEERVKNSANFVVCLGCRKRGHYLKDCPKANGGKGSSMQYNDYDDGGDGRQQQQQAQQLICFNCGSNDHALRACEKPKSRDGTLPFASCFICKQKGHISRDCPSNANGIYAKGGSCHVCGQKTHLAKDCPERSEEDKERWLKEQEEQRQREEDRKLGPRVAGISSKEEDGGGGDALGDDEFDGGGEVDSDDDLANEGKKRKSKSSTGSKSHKKKRNH
jgi:hypothetical protein